jgi:hypothetical protein
MDRKQLRCLTCPGYRLASAPFKRSPALPKIGCPLYKVQRLRRACAQPPRLGHLPLPHIRNPTNSTNGSAMGRKGRSTLTLLSLEFGSGKLSALPCVAISRQVRQPSGLDVDSPNPRDPATLQRPDNHRFLVDQLLHGQTITIQTLGRRHASCSHLAVRLSHVERAVRQAAQARTVDPPAKH